jgi:O-antigen/teichoic acid export membrane protein
MAVAIRRMAMPMRAVGARISWTILDQALSSVTNAALSFSVARSVSQRQFGAFAVAFTIYTVVIGISRALVSQPLTLKFAGALPGQFRAAAHQVTAAAALMGIMTAACTAVIGLLIAGQVGIAILALAITLPGLLVQDAWRLIFFAQGRPSLAALNDLVWTGVQVVTVGALLVFGWRDPAAFILAWGAAAALAGVFGMWQFRAWLSMAGSWAWFRTHRHMTGYLVAEFVGVTGAYQGALLLLGAVGGVSAVASLRAAQVLLGPLNILVAGVFAAVLPEIIRRHLDARGRRLSAIAVSTTMTVIPLLWTGVLLAVPYNWGVALLGATWPGGRSVLLASGFAYAGVGAALGPNVLLLAFRRTRDVFWLSMSLVPPLFLFGLVGVGAASAPGAAIGFALAQWLVVPLWWRRFRVVSREQVALSPV